MNYEPTILCIFDGWGLREGGEHNAVAAAHTPNFDRLWAEHSTGKLEASEGFVGLPAGQMGNSEVGHMTIGSGRKILQDLPRIDDAVQTGALAENAALVDGLATLKESGGTLHLMGLVSDGGVHSHQEHMTALAKIAGEAGVPVAMHVWLDGRDTPPRSADGYLAQLEAAIAPLENVEIATLSGRYYAMDRDNRWERVEPAYTAMVRGASDHAFNASNEAIAKAYESLNVGDEFVPPMVREGYAGMREGDGLLIANFRADRVREISAALCDSEFEGFDRGAAVSFAARLSMCDYSQAHKAWLTSLFPPQNVRDTVGEIVAKAGLKQLRIAETEKYAHVTFFANGGREEPFKGEDRILIPSPDVPTYDLQPEMSAITLTDDLVAAIRSEKYGFIFVNFANPDMVGHTGNFDAAVKALEALDLCLERVWNAVLEVNGALIVSADHGNVEQMRDPKSDQAHTAHTTNPVPVIVAAQSLEKRDLGTGTLADLAPTALKLMGLDVPAAMDGTPLV